MKDTAEIGDGSLAQAAAAGDLAAFEALVRRYQHLLYRDALGYLGSHDEALDAVQEALIGALKRFDQLREPVKVGHWLRTAVRRRSLNMLRAHRRRVEAHARYGDAVEDDRTLGSGVPGPVASLLDQLPLASATAFLLHYVDGLPLEAVARDLGATPASVKQRLYRARRHLRREALVMAKQQRSALPDDFAAHVVAHLLKSGRDDRLHMRYEAAQAHFNEILDLEPEHLTALLEWGRTYDPFGWPGSDQVGALERAAQAAPESLEVLAELELAYRQPGFEAQGEELRQKLLDLADRRLATDRADGEALYCKARLLRGARDFAQALALLEAALQQMPENQAVRYDYGLCLSRLNCHGEAMPVYQSVLHRDQTTFGAYSAHRQLATHLAYRADDIEAAVQHLEAAWRLSQKVNEAGNLIYFYSGAGRLDQGLELYEGHRAYPYPARVYAAVGMGYVQAGRWDEAERAFDRALEKAPDGEFAAEMHLHLARIAHQSERLERTDGHLRQGLALDPGQRHQLAGPQGSPFWRQWTQWLVETLEVVGKERRQVQDLLEAIRSNAV